jgi:hypothetical protein
VFRAIRKNGVAKSSPLEAGEIARLLKDMATKAGLDPTKILGHSARVGVGSPLNRPTWFKVIGFHRNAACCVSPVAHHGRNEQIIGAE